MTNTVIVHDRRPAGVEATDAQAAMRAAFDLAQRDRRGFACMMVQVDDLGLIRRALGDALADDVRAAVIQLVRTTPGFEPVVGHLIDDHLLLGLPLEDGDLQGASDALLDASRRLTFEAAGRKVRVTISVGVATNLAEEVAKKDGLLFDCLMLVAAEGVQVASSSGGDQWAHTELYALIQGGLERREAEKVAAQAESVTRARAAAETERAAAEERAALERTKHAQSEPAHAGPDSAAAGTAAPAPAPAPAPEPLNGAAQPTGSSVPPSRDPVAAPVGGTSAETSPPSSLPQETLGVLIRNMLAGSGGAVDPNVGDSVVSLVTAWMEEERKRTLETTVDVYQQQVDLLERRVRKLNETLERTEAELSRMAHAAAVDTGVASQYRSVQGLVGTEEQYEMKLALMADLFRANIELRRRLRA